jgi:CRISPR-associated protein Cmr1
MDRIHETGIIGSIRWWYEVIARGLGYYVCDPTSETRCPNESEKEKKKEYCSACLLFGATGYKRRFRFSIDGSELETSNPFKIFSGRMHTGSDNEFEGGWYINAGSTEAFEIHIKPLDNDFDHVLVQLPLRLASNLGALGAKTQLGYGVFSFEQETEPSITLFAKALTKISSEEKLKKLDIHLRSNANNSSIYPNLREMFFATIRFRISADEWWKEIKGLRTFNETALKTWIDNNSAPISPTIKNWFRYDDNVSKFWKTERCRKGDLANWLFGTIRKDGNIASKINISGAYNPSDDEKNLWEFQIWGWIPTKYERCRDFNREDILNRLMKLITDTTDEDWQELLGRFVNSFELHSWREFNSARDTFGLLNSMNDFIDSLINKV